MLKTNKLDRRFVLFLCLYMHVHFYFSRSGDEIVNLLMRVRTRATLFQYYAEHAPVVVCSLSSSVGNRSNKTCRHKLPSLIEGVRL